METNAPRMCALLVGLPDVIVLAVDDQPGEPIRVHVEQRVERPRCAECETVAWEKDRPVVELVAIPAVAFGSAGSPATASAPCSTPARPTGTYSQPSHPAGIRRASFRWPPTSGQGRVGIATEMPRMPWRLRR